MESEILFREYTDEPLSLEEVAQLPWSAQSITEPDREFRAAPSAGATYPLVLYLVVRGGVLRVESRDLQVRYVAMFHPQNCASSPT